MIAFPCCKINLGLNVVEKRTDGYHNIETVFYPIPLTDALEIKQMSDLFPSNTDCDLKITGNAIDCNEQDNLVIKAYHLIKANFQIPRIHAHLYKQIPSQAGLGGGSSDAAFMIRLLDEHFRLNMGIAEMERYVTMLGADCPFFITADPSYATGIGNVLSPVNHLHDRLKGYHIVIIKIDVSVSTAAAYKKIIPHHPPKCCKDVITQPIATWREELSNDFEMPAFEQYPELYQIKCRLYDLGASYAQMSGSGSAMFGIFSTLPGNIGEAFPEAQIYSFQL
ncbi:4-(cytidine 5'-diphospho)-2-C-methyl-D-erythritol kinase [Prevotella sp. A2931]|uniref:4-diphosphocytidyl-2-C-methyl-D-erythritol kinase n=1 Tax=Prevotella illustrans TaxID=2800387 RepID=A0ABS3M7L1_9BACT|nr:MULTISPECIES: 4-(cytidine 5'-diphospho)-2-C-methyl-D-erythritol kinase [Prevotella]MBO1364155.1 4-(cytidine 5'-diphospho)-2-C-methyl-D-erythritol kinase [Prevotella illustrans]PTL24999.1 4-(cytidine 5'-diphospho)-2-C-methyl-D-erythritol kinase [Prevotella sp. oral taxon 820]